MLSQNLIMTVKQIFDEIAGEPSTNKKMEILGKYKDNEILKRVLYLANSKRIKFYIKQIPEHESETNQPKTLEWVLDSLQYIYNRVYTGHEAIKWLQTLFADITPDDGYILERIIEKDCKIGMGDTQINKVFPKLIEETPYMGAKPFTEELAKEIVRTGFAKSQIKMDGRYANSIIRAGEVDLESREGEPTLLPGAKFLNELSTFKDCVLNGELTIDDIPRYESNGIIASLVSIGKKLQTGVNIDKEIAKFEKEHMPYQQALDSIRYTVWDEITVDEYFEKQSKRHYYYRFLDLQAYLEETKPTMVSLVETRLVSTYEEALEHFQDALSKGFEGTILKSHNGTWKDGRPNWQVKMKLEITVDLKVVGFNWGTGKNSNVISSLNASSTDGSVNTKPTGMNEAMMRYVTDNQIKLIGTIVEVECSGLSKDSDGNYSLLHPRFKSFRDDKKNPDSLGSIMEIEAMAKGLNLTLKE